MEKKSRLETSFSFKGRLVIPKKKKDAFKSTRREIGMGAVLVGHECLVFGGYNGHNNSHCVYKYDALKKVWKLPRNDNGRFGSVRLTFINDDVLYAYTWNSPSERYMFVALDLILMEEWVPAKNQGSVETGFGAVGCFVEARNEAILYGGKKRSTDVHVYSVQRSSWYSPKASGQPPSTRVNHGVCCAGRQVFVIGGETLRSSIYYSKPKLLDIHILSMEGQRFSWSSPATTGVTPRGRFFFTTLCVGDRVFIYGGFGSPQTFHIYSIKEKRWYDGDVEVGNQQEGKVQFVAEVSWGKCNNAAVVCQDKLLLFGGSRVDLSTPFEIVPY